MNLKCKVVETARHKCLIDWYDFVFNMNCWMHLQFHNVCATGSLDTIAFRKYASTQHVFFKYTMCEDTWIHWYISTHAGTCSCCLRIRWLFSYILWTRRYCCSYNTQDVCMLQFHTLVLLLDTQVYFGHTAVSHVGAAGSLNTQV